MVVANCPKLGTSTETADAMMVAAEPKRTIASEVAVSANANVSSGKANAYSTGIPVAPSWKRAIPKARKPSAETSRALPMSGDDSAIAARPSDSGEIADAAVDEPMPRRYIDAATPTRANPRKNRGMSKAPMAGMPTPTKNKSDAPNAKKPRLETSKEAPRIKKATPSCITEPMTVGIIEMLAITTSRSDINDITSSARPAAAIPIPAPIARTPRPTL